MTLCMVLGGGWAFGLAGSSLYDKYPQVQDTCAQVAEWTGLDFPGVLDDDFSTRPDKRSTAQLRQVALSLGIADLFFSMGIRPRALGGVSVGGMIASALAGAISRQDLCEIFKYQEKLTRTPPDGRDLAFAALILPSGEDEALYLGPHRPDIYLGSTSFGTMRDGNRALIISGYSDELQAMRTEIEQSAERKAMIQIFEGWGALHCPLNQYIKDAMDPLISSITFHDPHTPLFSARIPGQLRTAEQVRQDFQENYTSFVSVSYLYNELDAFGMRLGITPGVGTSPELNRYPFPVLQIEDPTDVDAAVSTIYELDIDFM
jgi:[acyl-carrier-protein] S-malonyltransferase